MAMVVALAVFTVAMLAIGVFAQQRVTDVEEYVVAGRSLGLTLAVPTLLATWFGAGTLLVAADEVRTNGLRAAALDPLGAGVCLLLAAVLIAGPLWSRNLTTLPDFYRQTYGPRAEIWASVLMVPGYLGWIAAQFTALAGLLTLTSGLPPDASLVIVAGVGLIYTVAGGMWAVTLTDAVQMALVVVGLFVLAAVVLWELGDGAPLAGAQRLWAETPADRRIWIPGGEEGVVWGTAFLAGALGNLPGQDLTQRIFAARSARTAQLACLIAGVAYLTLGMVPIFVALSIDTLAPDLGEESVLAVLAGSLLHPAVATVFTLTVASAVLSTIDSAILAPATVLARNVAGRFTPETIGLHRLAVLVVGLGAMGVAFLGEDAYSLLEASYEIGMVSLLVPLLMGVHWPRSERACLACMAVGTGLWLAHTAMGLEGLFASAVPVGLGSTLVGAVVYALPWHRLS
ncbi:MAG: sodium:solute symporter family protein [Alphaproteobacteria bacterium]|nr:sodium:solute symporter family protein [Alphaproteobacteria bacterium]